MELDQEVRRGKEAEMLLEHPLLIEAFRRAQGELMNAWFSSPPRDIEGRESIYMGVRMLQKLESCIKEHVVTGKMAAMQLHRMSEETSNVQH